MEERLILYLNNNNGYIRTKDFAKINIARVYIPKFIDLGIIRKITRGIYIANNKLEDEYYIFQQKYKNSVFSYLTSLYLLEMSERTPNKLDVTIIKNYHVSKNYNVNVHYVTKEKFDIGIIQIYSPYGNKIKVYNKERSICDMIKHSDEFELELYNKILVNYMKSKDKDLNKLVNYAKMFNIYDKVISILEVLIE